MKTLVMLLLLSSASVSHAVTNGRFLGQQFMINIAAQNPDGSSDDFPQKLFEVMNVPIQDSMLGPGKSLKAPERTLNFICANRTSGGYTCMLLIHRTANAQLGLKTASFKANGELAQALGQQFFLGNEQKIVLSNAEHTLEIQVTPTDFSIRFDEQGL
ncbi:hypothetical protein [Bdellovibrio sp. NC01]|uniref:hypothetical protein n=1 Tax=Bdellovibrio sp. NC01 TaxID=2220073 RepID=UPI00115C3F5A|nr:hypothetical protein [Bdellovibrio sp. NC01]QDK37755.1 hypothetical protein DOE51_09255 [Bdellovibrio sp. NC01]